MTETNGANRRTVGDGIFGEDWSLEVIKALYQKEFGDTTKTMRPCSKY